MTKGTKAFRIIISILLGLTIAWTAFISVIFVYFGNEMLERTEGTEYYEIFVAGVGITSDNAEDVLGDGTVSYNPALNTLTFTNANIESEYPILYSFGDLAVLLEGENEFICRSGGYAIIAVDGNANHSLSIEGSGSMTLDHQGGGVSAVGIMAGDLLIGTDVTVTMPACENIVNGIVCDDSLLLVNRATLTVNGGSGKYGTAVRVRGNALFEEGSAMNVSVATPSTDATKALSVNGDLVLNKNVSLTVTMNDEGSGESECVFVTGMIEVFGGATLTASAKQSYSVESYGAVRLAEGATLTVATDGEGADLFCSGAVIDYGATVVGQIEALGEVHHKAA